MHIYLETTYEDFPVSSHAVTAVELRGEDITVGVTSTDVSGASFYRTLKMPLDAFTATPYPMNVYNWLVSPGQKFDGGVVVTGDEPSLPEKQNTLVQMVESVRDDYIHGGVTFNALPIDTDEVSLRNIMGTAQMATLSKMSGQPFLVTWRCADNTDTDFDADTFIALASQCMQHVQDCYTRSWELKAEIAGADDSTIDTINIGAGWPSA